MDGLREATFRALLHANYVRSRLRPFYDVRFISKNGLCAHEFVIDFKEIGKSTGVNVLDVAKRLQVEYIIVCLLVTTNRTIVFTLQPCLGRFPLVL